MHLLITGGCGFIGSNLVRFMLEHRPEWSITNLDALTYCGRRENLADLENDSRYRFVQGDVRDGDLLADLLRGTDAVLHLAAESHVDRSIADARPFVETNVLGTQTLLDALRATPGNKRLVHVSTDEVYGDLPLSPPDRRFTEDSPLRPNSPYAASKAGSDLLVSACHHTHGINACITRCSNNLGPYQFPEKLVPRFITSLMEGRKVPVYGDGLYVRDWIDVDDHCDALLAVLERGETGAVYNIGGVNEISNLDLTHDLLRQFGVGAEMIDHVTDRPGHDRRYAVDGSKIERELDWQPTRSGWQSMLERTVNWYRANESWWRKIADG